VRGKALAEGLHMRALSRMWQLLLKALEEVGAAPNAMMAAEMAIIRLTHVADLPTPDEIVKKLTGSDAPTGPRPVPSPGGGGGSGGGAQAQGRAQPEPMHRPEPAPSASAQALIEYQSFAQIVALIREKRDMVLLTDVESYVRLARFAPGRIEFAQAPNAPSDLAQRLSNKLNAWTGGRWMVSVSREGGTPSIAEQRREADDAARTEATAHPMVAAALATFPGARITELRDLNAMSAEDAPPPPPEYDDEDYGDDWSPVDPFAE
jgi:DNA polymerase-3 subunit gamma/tau